MKKIGTFLLSFMLLLSVCNVSLASNTIEVGAKAAVLLERDSGRILFQKNANVKLPMASTTKVMTAILAIENGKLDDVVTIDDESSGVEGSSIWLEVGEKMKLEDLLYGLMLSSGNDSAIAIAKHIGGSVDGFATMMNQKAKEIGAMDSNFVNPNGLHHENHYTTAYDLGLIGCYAMKNDTFAKIVSTKNKVIPWESSKWDRALRNKNKILSQYDGGNGIKTGYTSNAGKCLVGAAKKDDMQLITVVLNSPDMFLESEKMLDYGFNNYAITNIYEKGQNLGSVAITDGVAKSVDFVIEKPLKFPVTANEKQKLTTNISMEKSVKAPIIKDQPLGNIEIFIDGGLIGQANLLATETVAENTILYNIKKIINQIGYKQLITNEKKSTSFHCV